MGLVTGEEGRYAILSDIQGIEDFLGDMDFKVAGTARGVNALQMDIKIKGLTEEILRHALEQARQGRLFILDKMNEIIATPRPEMSPYAPRMVRMRIPVEKIGAVIGPGGRVIRAIIEETNTSIEVSDDGVVTIGSPDQTMLEMARSKIEGLTRELVVGDIITGKVTRTTSFGAFVELLPGREGLLRNEEMGEIESEIGVGLEVTVMIQEIDALGRLNLSRRALFGDDGGRTPAPRPPAPRPHYADRGGDRGRPRNGGMGGGRPGFGDRDRNRRPGPGGPGGPRPGGPRPGGYNRGSGSSERRFLGGSGGGSRGR
jgi:polyribonucleotide nucleotidyltransferase